MAADQLQPLLDAAARNCPADLAIPLAGRVLQRKTRLVAVDLNSRKLWVTLEPDDVPSAQSHLASRGAVQIMLQVGQHEGRFLGPILAIDPAFPLNASQTVIGLCVQMPAGFQLGQRRRNYRVAIEPADAVGVRIWRIPEHAILREVPPASSEFRCELLDLSVGGLRARARARGRETLRLVRDQRLRVELTLADHSQLLLEARHRHPLDLPDSAAEAVLGIAFVNTDRDLDARKTINRVDKLVGELQRRDMRRRRAA